MDTVKHVGIIFSGGPAPAANAVIAAAATACIRQGIRVTGILRGYQFLQAFTEESPLIENEHYMDLNANTIEGLRNTQGIILHNSRTNPASRIDRLEDLRDPEKNSPIINIFNAFEHLKIDALISIGGDDTLKTANYLYIIQKEVPGLRPVKIVHVPKTIDNDYHGIDWTFGFFSAAEYAAQSIRNLGADSFTSGSYFIVELMGRKAGWLTYAAGIMGEAIKICSVEDITDNTLDLDNLATEISGLVEKRKNQGRDYGVICVAEGIADKLPEEIKSKEMDSHGNIVLTSVGIAKMLAERCTQVHEARTGTKVKFIPQQIGYETRCASPSGFDVVLASQLGAGAGIAVSQKKLSGVMVSIAEQMEITYCAFNDLIDETTGLTRLKFIEKDSDFWRLARLMEYK
ncbi:MAG: 6-phosphofructokinase [Thermodesulfobacteriota bacterium]|nr:6-phosphofructokinase [Thermodesulfobacteriota bacterium]